MTAWRILVAAAVALLAAPSAQALTGFEPARSAAQGCARPKAGGAAEPEYPPVQLNRNELGRVHATVTLPGGPLGPKVTISKSEGADEFRRSVEQWLERLEAPCLEAGASATLSYEFVFQPDRRKVFWSPPDDAEREAHKAYVACLRHEDGDARPDYPEEAMRSDLQGRLYARLNFTAPDRAPEVDVLHRDEAVPLARAVRRWVKGLRMPCHTGSAVLVQYTFTFVMGGDSAYGFKPLTLLDLLSLTRGIRSRALSLDTSTMGCPFELRMRYLQPKRPNEVGEVGERDPRRRPVIELLQAADLELRAPVLNSVYADTVRVSVPCIKLNLNPKEKTS
jgi:hypothetical protein